MIKKDEILYWLHEKDPHKLEELWKRADTVRRETVGDAVHLRGLIEISSFCRRNCLYCGVRAGRKGFPHYRMKTGEILASAELAARFGYGTVVLQAGEDAGLSDEYIADIISIIKQRFSLAVTLSLGERGEEELRHWRGAGADRYLLRFETSRPALFEAIHPSAGGELPKSRERIALLLQLRKIGYEIGSGVMIGIPGQTPEDLADDLELFRTLDLDMIGTGPYLDHPQTPLGVVAEALRRGEQNNPSAWRKVVEQTGFGYPIPPNQVEASNLNGFKMIALTRLVRPDANIPSTTAIASRDAVHGRISGLERGANVIMPNLTPTHYRALYDIYPQKAAIHESAEETHRIALRQLDEAGRVPGTGPGSRLSRKQGAS